MKIRKYLEVLSGGLGGIKTNEDEHFIRDENVPFKSLRSDADDDDDDDDDDFDDDLDELDYDEHGLDKSDVFDTKEERRKSEPKFDEGYTQEDFEADMESLTYLIRQLFKNTNIEVDVDYDGLDIKLYVFLNKREKMKSLLKIFDLVYKLKKDILPQYHSEVELYQSKVKDPVLCFMFDYMEVGGNISTNKGDEKFNQAGITDRDADLPF